MRFHYSLFITIVFIGQITAVSSISAARPDVNINVAEISIENGVYLLDANVDYELSKAAKEALRNGVQLIFRLEVELLQLRKWWLDRVIADLTQRYRLKYHALSRQYVIENLNTGVQETFPDLSSALRHQGEVINLPIIDSALFERRKRYACRIRANLALDELPLPLRVTAYLSPQWQIGTDWYTVNLP